MGAAPYFEISTHAPLAGRDRDFCAKCKKILYFNPRAPCGARLFGDYTVRVDDSVFQPTRPLRGATVDLTTQRTARLISTHAPLAGRDPAVSAKAEHEEISTHAPLAGRDGRNGAEAFRLAHFNPRAPCGARHHDEARGRRRNGIFQPTRPLRGATYRASPPSDGFVFQPTRPLRGATYGSVAFYTNCIFQPTRPLRGATGVPDPRADA